MVQHVRRLKRLLRGLGRSREDAEDLIQEAFMRLHVYCKTHEVKKPEGFLVRVVQNLSIDAHRGSHAELYVDEPVETLPIFDCRPTPDEDLALVQRLHQVRAILDSLKPRTREVFLMHRVEGQSSAQIAAAFGIGEHRRLCASHWPI